MSPSEGGYLAALFPGQNSQTVGMARELYESSGAAKAVLDQAEAALPGLLEIMWDGPEERLKLTANQQPALVAAGVAAYAAWHEAGGEEPSFGAGHSLGEFTALVVAGSLPLGDAVQLVRKRGEYMQEAVAEGAGAMAAILKADTEFIREVCRETEGVVEVANFNAPGQTVISGEARAVEAASSRLAEQRARVVPLKVSAPFHCSLMKPAADRLAHDLRGVEFEKPAFGVISNVTAELHDDPAAIAGLLERQVTSPVRWVDTLRKLHALGVRRFVEFGSGKVLTGLVGRTLEEVTARAVTDPASLREALA
ncbi:MAG TPA: ACP S-malonyltransferase [Trueperaceae bacterium]